VSRYVSERPRYRIDESGQIWVRSGYRPEAFPLTGAEAVAELNAVQGRSEALAELVQQLLPQGLGR
jgi:hypothetical protein